MPMTAVFFSILLEWELSSVIWSTFGSILAVCHWLMMMLLNRWIYTSICDYFCCVLRHHNSAGSIYWTSNNVCRQLSANSKALKKISVSKTFVKLWEQIISFDIIIPMLKFSLQFGFGVRYIGCGSDKIIIQVQKNT